MKFYGLDISSKTFDFSYNVMPITYGFLMHNKGIQIIYQSNMARLIFQHLIKQ